MLCPHCGSAVAAGDPYCESCGQPLGLAAAAVGAPADPFPPVGVPGTVFRVGDLAITLEGDRVPIANVDLGTDQTIYFEHHILLWKQPDVAVTYFSRSGMARRFFAGTLVFLSQARGPGNLAVSREAVGQIVAIALGPGEAIDVREHQFLLATSTIEYGSASGGGVANAMFTRTGSRTGLSVDRFTGRGEGGLVLLHGYGNVFYRRLEDGEQLDVEPGGWLWKDASVRMGATSLVGSGHGGLLGALSKMSSGVSIALNRFTGPGRIGIQSMTYVPQELREATEHQTSPQGFLNGGAPGFFSGR
ncbi:MAG TPA: AIM24 family protein [Ktedonobacterales bacterium]|jgi:uncharacterized protein (AIM24 family)